MLIFVGPRRHRTNIAKLATHPGAPRFAYRSYNWLFRAFRLPSATYIFTQIDRLDAAERRLAGRVFRHLNSAGPGHRAFNDPAHAKNRYRLLRALHDQGLNDFDVNLASEQPKPKAFPVFIRRISLATPPLTNLIDNQKLLDGEIKRLAKAGEPLDDLVVTEFCAEQIEPGIYQKWSMFNSGGQFCLKHSNTGKHWFLKHGQLEETPSSYYEEEWQKLTRNSYVEHFKKVFEIAKIDYGRADFGIVKNRVQTYEINFNPRFSGNLNTNANKQRNLNVAWVFQRRVEHIADMDIPNGRSIENIVDPEITAFRLRFWRNYAPQRY